MPLRVSLAGSDVSLEDATRVARLIETQVNGPYEDLYNEIVCRREGASGPADKVRAKQYLASIRKIRGLLSEEFNVPEADIVFYENRRYPARRRKAGQSEEDRPGGEAMNIQGLNRAMVQRLKIHLQHARQASDPRIGKLTDYATRFIQRPSPEPEVVIVSGLPGRCLRIPVIFNAEHMKFDIPEPVFLGVFFLFLGDRAAARGEKEFMEAVAKLHESQIDKTLVLMQSHQEIRLRHEFDKIADREEAGNKKRIEEMLRLIVNHTSADHAFLFLEDRSLPYSYPVGGTVPERGVYWEKIQALAGKPVPMLIVEDPAKRDAILVAFFHPINKEKLVGGILLVLDDLKEVFSLFDVHLVNTFVTMLDTFLVACGAVPEE